MNRLVPFCALVAIACHEDADPLDLAGPAASVTELTGSGHIGGVGESLSLAVRVTDTEGRPVIAYPVQWSASRGSIPPVDSTDDEGVSRVGMVLPDTPGIDEVIATVSGVGTATLRVTTQPIGGAIVFRFLDAGGYHACGITTTEQLLCWGYGADGQLGIGSTDLEPYPTLVAGAQRYRMVTGGYYHACAFTLATNAYCWGNNSDGRLGGGSAGGQADSPVKVLTTASMDTTQGDTVVGNGQIHLSVQALQAGWGHSCGIDPTQRAWCWGRNSEGQTGNVGVSRNAVPVGGDLFKSITVGGMHSCAITLSGAGLCWGYNAVGQLGFGPGANTATPTVVAGAIDFATDPLVIFRSPDPDFPLPPGPFMDAGYDHTCGIAADGAAFCWGLNQDGQLGNGGTGSDSTPQAVSGGHTFAGITAGLRHTCGLTVTGEAWCWGDNTYGELGDGTNTRSRVPVRVAGDLTFAYLSAGELFTCGITSAGGAYCWGDNEYGQLGDGTFQASSVPVRVAFQP